MVIDTNEVLYRITKALNISQKEILEMYRLEEYPMESHHLQRLLTSRFKENFTLCSYEELGVFLDGLVTFKRGKNPNKAPLDETVELTTNLILKKLRVALKLKEAETEIIFNLGEVTLSKQQLASLFRKENHKNFKNCSNELLMAFLAGLDEFYFTEDEE